MNRSIKIAFSTTPEKTQPPDLKNQSKMTSIPVQTTSIKRYLESIQSNNKIQNPPLSSQTVKGKPYFHSSQKTQRYDYEQILRKRISQLELENNQFRLMAKQYQALARKNKQLQRNMVVLLSELADSQQQSLLHNVQNESDLTKWVTLGQQIERNQESNTLNQSIKHYIHQKVRAEVGQFQSRIMEQLQAIERKLQQLKISQEYQSKKVVSSSQGRYPEQSNFHLQLQREIRLQDKAQNDDWKNQESFIEIEIDNVSDSEHSFGKSSKPRNSKMSIRNIQNSLNYKSGSSQGNKQGYSEALVKKIQQGIDDVRKNLSVLISSQTKLDETLKLQYENRIFEQLQKLITSFFSDRKHQSFSLICQDNFRESLVLREKMKFTANQQAQHKSQYPCNENAFFGKNSGKVSSNIGQKHSIQNAKSQQFQVTCGKLKEFLEIMKFVNSYFRKMIEKNSIPYSPIVTNSAKPQALKQDRDF